MGKCYTPLVPLLVVWSKAIALLDNITITVTVAVSFG